MPAQRRTASQERGRKTQRRVLEGAARVFSTTGYGSAAMRGIAEESGVSLGTINFHFGTKDQIALAIIAEQRARSAARAEEVIASFDTVTERLVQFSIAAADQLRSDPIVQAGFELSVEAGDFIDPSARSYAGWSVAIEAMLHAGIESGEIRPGIDVPAVADTYLACFTGVQLLSRVRSGREDLFTGVRNLWTLIADGLFPEERKDEALRIIAEAFDEADRGAARGRAAVNDA
ncbi:TetR/AcrR family transcriptional regulator [Leucobacter sp. CSA2]|uniref:TetR/AcrR family transcriptional regulator n=1 Tax=Leucobacter edaphi TaxID=2796472 RepID=A0A934QB25_9MICO|nr:TetR/AcrR family transcriptional regulator [Leucobacter edaphi]MBK0421440.1 TetR/AcrR family transcriptional regulator [Leucobacter edaphi]